MPTRFIQRAAALRPQDVSLSNANAIFVDSDDNQLKFTTGASGTTTVDVVTESQTQTLTNKTFTSPTVNSPVVNSGAAVAATGPEIDNVADVSARMVAGGATLAMVAATHSGRIIALDTLAGSVVTLPASSGGGAVYEFLVTVTATSNSHIIQVANATDEFRGFVVQDASEATAPNIFWAADNDDTITLNRTTTGLAAQGEYFRVVDAVSGVFFVTGYSQASGIEATPFSNAVS